MADAHGLVPVGGQLRRRALGLECGVHRFQHVAVVVHDEHAHVFKSAGHGKLRAGDPRGRRPLAHRSPVTGQV
jgi:hypothetical protein